MHIYQNKKERKCDKKGIKGIFVGYLEETKRYRTPIWFEGREVSLSKDVIFKENSVIPLTATATQLKIIIEKEEEANSKGKAEDEEDNNDKEKLENGEQMLIGKKEQIYMTFRDTGTLNKTIWY